MQRAKYNIYNVSGVNYWKQEDRLVSKGTQKRRLQQSVHGLLSDLNSKEHRRFKCSKV